MPCLTASPSSKYKGAVVATFDAAAEATQNQPTTSSNCWLVLHPLVPKDAKGQGALGSFGCAQGLEEWSLWASP